MYFFFLCIVSEIVKKKRKEGRVDNLDSVNGEVKRFFLFFLCLFRSIMASLFFGFLKEKYLLFNGLSKHKEKQRSGNKGWKEKP